MKPLFEDIDTFLFYTLYFSTGEKYCSVYVLYIFLKSGFSGFSIYYYKDFHVQQDNCHVEL